MTAPWARELRGRIDVAWIDSDLLRGNPLEDPSRRPVWVYCPPGYDQAEARYPAVYQIQGMTGQVDMWGNRSAFRPTYLELLDEQMAGGLIPPCIVVFCDCWTSLGGSQFLDSTATGRYHSYLCQEIVPWVDARYRTLAAAAHRGLAGHSSGGYGAMVTPMLRPDLWGGMATHAGDALFELCYLPDFGKAARSLRDEYTGSFERFLADFRSRPAFTKASDYVLLNTYTMAACYSAEPDGTVRLPFDLETGQLVPEVWERWLRWDPVRMAGEARYEQALRGLRGVYVDAGRHDDYLLDLGAQAFARTVRALGVEVRFELFEGGHGGVEYRYPLGLRYLAEHLR